jgi:RNA polymerase sigma factor (sigma-70 family)
MPARPAAGLADCIRSAVRRVTDAAPADAELLAAFTQNRDPAAFEAIVRRHGPLVANVCRGVLPSPADSDDAFQATFLVLSRKAGSVRGATLPGWLFRVARRAALEVKRAADRRRAVEMDAARTEVAAEPDLSWREAVALLHEELDRLPAKYRDPLVLCHLDGQTRDEATVALGCSVDSVRGRLSRGRAKLGARLRKRGLALSVGLLATVAGPRPVPAEVVRNVLQPSTAVEAVARAIAPARPWAAGSALAVAASLFFGVVLVEAGTADPPKQADPPAKSSAKADAAGDPLPDGAVARLGTLRFNHGDGLSGLLYAADGKTVVSVGRERARVWDAATGAELSAFDLEPVSWDQQVALTPDGKTLIFLGQEFNGDPLQVFDLTTGKEVRRATLRVKRSEISVYRRNAFSPDGSRCALHTPKQVHVFDVQTAAELCVLPKVGTEVADVAFAGPDHVVTAGKDDTIEVWDAKTGKAIRSFAHDGPVGTLVGSPDGRFVATLSHHTEAVDRLIERDAIQVWDVATGKRLHKFVAPGKGWYRTPAVSADGKRVGGTAFFRTGGRTDVWDVTTGKPVATLEADGTRLALAPDGRRLALGALPGKFDVWDLGTGRATTSEAPDHARARSLFLTADRVTTLGYQNLKEWDLKTGRVVRKAAVPYHPDSSAERQLSPDGRTAVTFSEPTEKTSQMTVWDTATGNRLYDISLPDRYALAFAPDSSRLAVRTGNKDAVITVRETRSGKELAAIPDLASGWTGRLFLPVDSDTVVAAGDRIVGYGIEDGKTRFSWRVEQGTPPDRVAPPRLGGGEREAPRWRSITISPDGQLAAFVRSRQDAVPEERMQNRLGLADARTGRLIRNWNDSGRFGASFEVLCFSADGRLLATSDGPAVHLWDVATGAKLRTFEGHRGTVESMAFRGDGRTLASSARDGTLVVWNLSSPLPTKADPTAWWADLLADDAVKAWAAVWHFADAADDEIMPFLRDRLKPVPAAEVEAVQRAIRELDSDRFAVREKAAATLETLGHAAGPALRAALERKPSAEARQRIEALLEKVVGPPTAGEPVRAGRALAALERKGTPEAKRLLKDLAAGADGAWLTVEARAALRRAGR